MLGNSILRNPRTRDNKFDKGVLCESLLFFGSTHLVIDFPTLAHLIQADFLDDLIEMLKRGYLTANFSPEMAVIYTENTHGLREHCFTVAKLGGNEKTGYMERNVDVLEFQLRREVSDAAKSRRYFRQLADLLSFKDIGDTSISLIAREDVTNPSFAREITTRALVNKGVPPDEIKFSQFDILKLDGIKFAIATDIDFDRLSKFIPEEHRSTFNQNDLLSSVIDARVDLHLAASLNAALIGNESNQEIVDLILKKSIGTGFKLAEAPRAIYDSISVATPSVREVINSRERTPGEFMKLLDSSAVFKKWLNEQNPNSDLIREMLREKGETGWLETLPAKAMRFAIFTGLGKLADFYAPGVSVLTEGIDALLIEQLAKKWRPHYFVEDRLKGFLDKPEEPSPTPAGSP